jgi:hypothetical protein
VPKAEVLPGTSHVSTVPNLEQWREIHSGYRAALFSNRSQGISGQLHSPDHQDRAEKKRF